MGTERHGWRRVEAISLPLGGMQDCLRRVMPGRLVWGVFAGGWPSVRQRISWSTGAAGDAFLESDVSGCRQVTLVAWRRAVTESARALTQYGDLKGTIAIDGHNGLSVYDVIRNAAIPNRYQSIGLRIYGFSRGAEGPSVKAKELCVDTDQTGNGQDDIRRFGNATGERHTFEFDAQIDLEHLTRIVKRYDIVLLAEFTCGIEVKV